MIEHPAEPVCQPARGARPFHVGREPPDHRQPRPEQQARRGCGRVRQARRNAVDPRPGPAGAIGALECGDSQRATVRLHRQTATRSAHLEVVADQPAEWAGDIGNRLWNHGGCGHGQPNIISAKMWQCINFPVRTEPAPMLVAGVTGRALAASAVRGGHPVVVLDYFADRDTCALAVGLPIRRVLERTSL